MELPNRFFGDFPIEFKEINPEDFPHFDVENNRNKIIIEPNENGHINNELQSNIDLDAKNTVIVNAAVGQGKTYSIVEIVKKYYEEENYLIIVAVPFVSLVQQYLNNFIEKGIPENQIYRYEKIGRDRQNPTESKIQILTVNALLGNPGKEGFINHTSKRDYINSMINYCEGNEKKVVFIYDEIHDAIHNFKEEYIFNLWKWRGVIHKNIILSATFNEASKVVIEYLAELTEGKIQIIESRRNRFPEKQSELYLHYNNAPSYTNKDNIICELVDGLIRDNKQIDILSFSKKIAEDICKNKKEGVGKLLYNKFDNIQKCVSELDDNQWNDKKPPENRFDNTKCNVGTNFKTGISIDKENHAFIIIMPPRGNKTRFENYYGIFKDGINSVIQALARQRTRGEIHIVLPYPNVCDYDSLPFGGERRDVFKSFYQKISFPTGSSIFNYKSVNEQNSLLEGFYNNDLKENIRDEITAISSSNRSDKVRLAFPEFKLFKMTTGERYLANKFDFFGNDLSSFITYSAITNQFINCVFSGYFKSKSNIVFKQDEIHKELYNNYYYEYEQEKQYNEYMEDLHESSQTPTSLPDTDSDKYHKFKAYLNERYNLFLKKTDKETINPFKNKDFERHLLMFFQEEIYYNISSNLFLERHTTDKEYSRGEYFNSCISHSLRLNSEGELNSLNNSTQELISAYLSLNYFREKLINSKQNETISRRTFEAIPNTPNEGFITSEDQDRFTQMIESLSTGDYFIKNEIFDFKDALLRQDTPEGKVNTFYKYLVKDFLVTESKRINRIGDDRRVKVIISIILIVDSSKTLDFITPRNYTEEIPEEEIEEERLNW